MSYLGKEVIIKSNGFTEGLKVAGKKAVIIEKLSEFCDRDVTVKLLSGKIYDGSDTLDLYLDNLIFDDDDANAQDTTKEIEPVLINPKDHTLVFVQSKIGNDWVLYQDGEIVKGLKSVDIYAECDSATSHTVSFVTGATK